MKNFKLPDFLADLKKIPWPTAYTFDNADDDLNGELTQTKQTTAMSQY